jgi:hypothetical protein
MAESNWQDRLNKWKASLPDDIREAHIHSDKHRAEILGSTLCGCFYCCSIFSPDEIIDWTDNDSSDVGQTALCPKCGIDSVIGDLSGYEITVAFLSEMNMYWFSRSEGYR